MPANSKARVSSVKSAENIKTIRDFEAFLRDVGRFSHGAAKAIASRGFKSSGPRDEDEAQAAIADEIVARSQSLLKVGQTKMENEILDLIAKQGKAWKNSRAQTMLVSPKSKSAAPPIHLPSRSSTRSMPSSPRSAASTKSGSTKSKEVEPTRSRRRHSAGRGAQVVQYVADLSSQKNSRPNVAPFNAEQYSEYKAAFTSFLRKDQRAISESEYKALAAGSDPDGGYLCQAEMDSAIDRVVASQGSLRQLATIRPIGVASYKKLATTSGASAGGWGSEATAPSESGTPSLKELEFVPGLLWAEPRATVQLLEDSAQNVESWLADEVGITFAEQESQAFITGSGINRPQGILSYTPVANASVRLGLGRLCRFGRRLELCRKQPSDALVDTIHALKRQYRGGASWMMNDSNARRDSRSSRMGRGFISAAWLAGRAGRRASRLSGRN